MATENDFLLVRLAADKRSENPDYTPNLAELKAIDAVLIAEAQSRLNQRVHDGIMAGNDLQETGVNLNSYD